MDAIKRKRLRTVALFSVVATVLGTMVGALFVAMGEPAYWPPRLGAAIGVAMGLGMGVSEEFFIPRVGSTWSFRRIAAYRMVAYAGLVAALVVLGNGVVNRVETGVSMGEGVREYLSQRIFFRDMAFAVGTALLAIVGLQLSKLHRFRDVSRLLTGRYYSPEAEERVVLFADIVGSSAIVERLGPVEASQFLRDCFADVSEPILAWRGQVYQHVGDGVVITWPDATAGSVQRGIECFFGIRRSLAARGQHYLSRYEARPEVRAAMHLGGVVATWVGEAKRELALHGDVMHATARLQSRCQELGATFLVSADCLQQVGPPGRFDARDVGVLDLRGLEQGIHCFDLGGASGPEVLHPGSPVP